jgi:redox-sensitive bicupin YhaK (pirin superfamily)
MIHLRPAEARGHANHGWLDTWHTFSFDSYYDPEHMGFRCLRVINQDRIAPGAGFGMHPHRDMEIVTWVLDGALAHRDSLGSGGILRRGEAQAMTAGSGIRHSEENASADTPVHLLQIWIETRAVGLKPAYAQREFPAAGRRNRWQTIASGDGRDGSLVINQDAVVYTAELAAGATLQHRLAPGRHAWVQVARGTLTINGQALALGDGAAIDDEQDLVLASTTAAELLLFDLP